MDMNRFRYRSLRAVGTGATAALLIGTASFATTAQARHVGRMAAATPVSGGSYTWTVSNPPDCLDPQKTASGSSNLVDSFILDPLLSYNPKGRLVGDLATRYHVSSGGKKITFFLRQGVKFSNGDPFTAYDVKFTFLRALKPSLKSPATASDLAGLKTVKVMNKYKVQLELSAPNRPLLGNLASAYTGILDKKSIQANSANTCNRPVGTGLYKVSSTGTAFDDVVLTANKYHTFGPSWVNHKGVPYITRAEVKTIASPATSTSELLSNGVQVVSPVDGTQIGRLKGNKTIVLHKVPPDGLYFLEFNTAHAPFNIPAVRKAFAELINRKNIVKAALSGQGQAINGPLPPGIPDYSAAAGKLMPKFNISAAAKVIQQYHATGPYDLMVLGQPPYSTIAEILQAAAAQAGMQLKIDSKASLADFIPSAAQGNFDILSLAYSYTDPDILYLLLDSSQGGGNGLNWTNEKNSAKLDKLLEEGRTTSNPKKVASIYAQAQAQINKQL